MSSSMWGEKETQHFYSLSPDIIMDAIENIGIRCTGRCLTLNSMENRVYDIELDGLEYQGDTLNNVIAKFYRPGRWSDKQILEEHEFLKDLINVEIDVNAPIELKGKTLFKEESLGIYFSFFKKIGGRSEAELNDDHIEKLGRLLGRVHNVGQSKQAQHRLKINPRNYGFGSLQILKEDNSIPQEHKEHYLNQCENILKTIEPLFENIPSQRLHGDCHLGNVLWNHENLPLLVDFDDMVVGPRIQDFWLLFDWNDPIKKDIFIDAYEEFCEFPYQQLKLIEPLRTLRMIHFNAWISKRYEDPSFQQAFFNFQMQDYWSMQIAHMREQEQLINNIQASSIF